MKPMARKKTVDIAIIIPDASPVLTLARINRLDLLLTFNVPIRIVDQVHYEITKPQNDADGHVAAFLHRMGNQLEVVETSVGVGFKTRIVRDPNARSSNLGEEAVSEYARTLAKTSGPSFRPPDLNDFTMTPIRRLSAARCQDRGFRWH